MAPLPRRARPRGATRLGRLLNEAEAAVTDALDARGVELLARERAARLEADRLALDELVDLEATAPVAAGTATS